MGLTKLAIARPIAILMLVGAFIVLGLISYAKLPEELQPQVDFPVITITTTYAGTNPQEMETLITKPIEDSISGVSGIKQVTSSSEQGVSVVSVEFFFGTDLNNADADVIQKVDAIRKLLPTDADSPSVLKADTSSQPVMYYAMESTTRSVRDVRSIAQNLVLPALEQAPSVGAVTITGGDVREIRVAVRPDRLEAYGITISDLATAIANANVNVSTGFIQRDQQYFNVRLLGEFTSVDEIKNLRLTVNGKSFYVSDVADVIDTEAERTADASVNGTRAVTLVVQKTSDGNTLEAAKGVKLQIAYLKKILPPDIRFIEVIDLSTNVKSNLQDVVVSLCLGAFMAVIVVFVFLHNVRGTIIIAIAIPTSIIATFLPISLMGYTLNSMTLLGLSLAVGILVDDSIVVLENINRHLALGEEPELAAINGRGEIALAAITLTSVDLVVFLPIAFMGGIVGEFFRSFGMTVAIATLFSLFVSFSLTPMLAARWYKKGENIEGSSGPFAAAFDRGFHRFENFYQSLLRGALRHPYIVVNSGFVLLVVVAVVLFPQIGFRFAPGQDQNQASVLVECPAGSSLAYTKNITDQIEHIIRNDPQLNYDVKFVFTNLGQSQSGGAGAGFTGTQYANIALQLYDKKSILDTFSKQHLRPISDVAVAELVREKTAGIVGAKITASEVSGFGGGSAPVQIQLTGADFPQILSAAAKVLAVVKAEPGVINPDITYKNSQPEVQIRVDRTKAPEFGLTLQQISGAVAASMQGDITSKYRDPADGQQYDIRVQLTGTDRNDPNQVGNIVVGYQNNLPIYLSQVADIAVGAGPVKIDRLNRQRQVTVTGYLKPGFVVGNVTSDLGKKIAKLSLGGVGVSQGGEAQSLGDEAGYMVQAVVLGIVLAFMLMAALFNNVLYPFSIMLSLPQAWIGAMIALYVTGQPFSLIAVIGIVLLDGIVQKNAILLVDYTNTLRARGYKRIDALLQAGPTRLRPIIMTTLAIIVSSLPTALALGRGSGFRQSLGIVVIGGSSLSLLLTLLIVPSAYIVWDDIGNFFASTGNMFRNRNRRRRTTDLPLTPPTSPNGNGGGNGHTNGNGYTTDGADRPIGKARRISDVRLPGRTGVIEPEDVDDEE